MGVKVTRENFRVVVEPKDWGFFSGRPRAEGELRQQCEHIVDAIKRHVDDVEHVFVEHDVIRRCEHCGWNWTENSDEYNGGCCSQDEAAYDIDANWPDALERLCQAE